jgi:hypothetical protein
MRSTKNEENEELEEHALFSGQFKGNCRNCGRIGHKSFITKIFQATIMEITVTQPEEIIVAIYQTELL